MLYVSVSPAEELSRDLAVDQDGKIFIPIIGAVDAAGLSSGCVGSENNHYCSPNTSPIRKWMFSLNSSLRSRFP